MGQAFASRTYAELAAGTADLPAGVAAARPPSPAPAEGEPRIPRPGLVLTVATVLYAGVWGTRSRLLQTSRAGGYGHHEVALREFTGCCAREDPAAAALM